MMRQSSKRTFSGLVGVALLATACSGDADTQAVPVDDVGRSLGVASEVEQTATTTTTTVQAVAEETTTTTTVLAPSTLAFSSSDDIGRLFVIAQDFTAASSAGGLPDASVISAGTIVQASSQRESDDILWVRVESTALDGPTLGWVPVNLLEPTLESVYYQNAERSRELRQVSSAAPDDQLAVLASPGAGAAIRVLPENAIVMHGGTTGLSPSGDFWLDIVDPASGERTGWVEARYFSRVNGGEIQDSSWNSVSRSPEDGVSYGQALNGSVTLEGCNAVQVRFANSSSTAGIGMTFGTNSPLGRERSDGTFDWSGTPAFSEAGQDIIITVPTSVAQTWFFAPLDANEEANFSGRDADGFAIASDVVQIAVPASSCELEVNVDDEDFIDYSSASNLPEEGGVIDDSVEADVAEQDTADAEQDTADAGADSDAG